MKARIIAGTAIAGIMLAGCNIGAQASKGMGDARVNQSGIDKTPPNVIEFSDKYPNIEFKCNGSDGVYTNTRTDGYFVVIANDKQCR
jgi:hypothetical protein